MVCFVQGREITGVNEKIQETRVTNYLLINKHSLKKKQLFFWRLTRNKPDENKTDAIP